MGESHGGDGIHQRHPSSGLGALRRMELELGLSTEEERPADMPVGQWERKRSVELLSAILDLESPTLSDAMVNFVLEDGVCEILVGFITRVPDDLLYAHEPPLALPSPPESHDDHLFYYSSPEDWIREGRDSSMGKLRTIDETGVPVEVQRSYKATMMLTTDTPTNGPLKALLSERAKLIASSLFKVFWSGAKGSFYHACHVLEYLIRNYPDQVFDAIGHNSKCVERHIGPALKWLSEPPVADTVISKILTPPETRPNGPVKLSPGYRWKLFSSLSEWRLLVRLAHPIYELQCPADLASSCADVFLDVVDGLSIDDSGELLLQPIGHCPELVDGLIGLVCAKDAPLSRRTYAARVLAGLVKKAAPADITPPMTPLNRTTEFGMQPAQVRNRLSTVKVLLQDLIRIHLRDIIEAILNPVDDGEVPQGVSHPGYHVERPFTLLRYFLISLLVEELDGNRSLSSELPQELWQALSEWFFAYSHNNMYGSLFFRLVFIILRANDEAGLRALLSKCKLLSNLIHEYENGSAGAANRGYILKICNALRLQADTLPPSAFLNSFLRGHDLWRTFLPRLREITLSQQTPGMGFAVPAHSFLSASMGGLGGPGLDALDQGPEENFGEVIISIDHGSTFAYDMGFAGEVEWISDEETSEGTQKKKTKKKKKKKKKKNNSSKEIDEEEAVDRSASCSSLEDNQSDDEE